MTKEDTEIEVLPVPAPTMGIIGNVPTTMLNPRACVDCNNVVFKDGIVSTRTGYIAYGLGGITGTLLQFFRYQKWNGQEFEMLATTGNVYYNKDGVWTSIASSLNGSVDTRVSMAYIENYLVFTNGFDAPSKWDGNSWTALNASHSGDDIDWGDYRPLIFLPFHFRLVGLNDNKITTGASIRIMYSHAGNFDKIDGESYSGYIEMTQGMGAKIVSAAPLKNYIGMYKDYCCALLSYIGGASTFAINVQIEGIGLAAKDAIANLGTSHMFLGSDYNIYRWNGGTELEPVGNPIKKLLQAEVNRAKVNRSFAVVNIAERQVIFFLPVNNDEYPTRMWIWNLDDETWSKGTVATMSAGNSISIGRVERTLLGSGVIGWGCDHCFDGAGEPDAYPFNWVKLGGSGDYASSDGSVLTIDTTASVDYMCAYARFPGVNFSGGFTIRFKAQVISSTGSFPFLVNAIDAVSKRTFYLWVRSDSIYHEGTKICDYNTTGAYHVYRVYVIGTTATLYIDDVNKGSWTIATITPGMDMIKFGDTQTDSSINIKVDYFFYGFGNLTDPAGAASHVYHYDYEALDDNGDAIESDFETGDFVLDKIEHLIRNTRFYGLGLDLKGYSTSSRLTLEYSVDEGVTWNTVDKVEEELTAAYALYNWDFMQTTRKIRFRFSDDTASQKWYLRFFGIKQKEGERV